MAQFPSYRSSNLISFVCGSLAVSTAAGCAEPSSQPAMPEGAVSAAPAATSTPAATSAAPADTAPAAATAPEVKTEPAASAAPAASSEPSAAPAGPAEEVELTIRMDRLEKKDGKVIHDADRGRMTHHYRLYEMDAAELTAALGKKNAGAKEVVLRVAVTGRSTRTGKGDPKGAVPVGGFTYETMTCKIVKVVSAN